MNKFSKALMITSIFAVSSLLQAESSFGSNSGNSTVIPSGVNPTNANPSNVNPYNATQSNVNSPSVNPYGTNPSTSTTPSVNSYGTNPAGVNPSLTNPSTNPNPNANPHNNVYTQPSNLSSQGRLNTSYNEDKLTPISLSDDEITQKIRATIRNDRSLSDDAKNITVSTAKGNVTLKGYVANEEEKIKVATLSRKVAGVKSISNNINISSHH